MADAPKEEPEETEEGGGEDVEAEAKVEFKPLIEVHTPPAAAFSQRRPPAPAWRFDVPLVASARLQAAAVPRAGP